MADDALVLALAVVTLGRRKLHERGGRWLKLVSGVVMLALGLWLLASAAGLDAVALRSFTRGLPEVAAMR